MKKKIKIKKIYFVFLIITLVFFGIFVKMDFATDTYAVLESSRRGILQNFLQSGRLITAFFFSAFVVLKTPISIVYLLTFLAAIFSISFSFWFLFYLLFFKFLLFLISLITPIFCKNLISPLYQACFHILSLNIKNL